MQKRFVTIWFRHLKTDWLSRRRPELKSVPFVLSIHDHGRKIVTAANTIAEQEGIYNGIVVADAKAIFPELVIHEDRPGSAEKLLKSFASYCIRYCPIVAIDPPDGLILEVTGCSHLWGGDLLYITTIINRFKGFGYDVKAAIADTIGAAWAITHFDEKEIVIQSKQQYFALLFLSPAALRLEPDTIELLYKLGLGQIQHFIGMPRPVLKRRFGDHLIGRLDQALGYEVEIIHPVIQPSLYLERLPCLELILTRQGIEIALERVLESLCTRLKKEQKGLRKASFRCYRIDGKIQQIDIGVNSASHNSQHLYKLFELKIDSIEPAPGIELFIMEASQIEEVHAMQEKLWIRNFGLHDVKFSELLDRITNKIGATTIQRFLPDEHYWPERSIRLASSLHEELNTSWKTDKPRPVQLLSRPERIEVTAPIPDYPPMLFRYKGKLHKIKKVDGPERIEREWWMEEGAHRDYYSAEDEEGNRYWIFRSGHYDNNKNPEWFIHGFFA
ncbi:MAG TPA: DNA polymerase Y family protein [Chitinophagaceae bacterium]|jgi:protein ImuB|nr:DNA polymerase Y family protein [Chitinophagaceae bacterium]